MLLINEVVALTALQKCEEISQIWKKAHNIFMNSDIIFDQ